MELWCVVCGFTAGSVSIDGDELRRVSFTGVLTGASSPAVELVVRTGDVAGLHAIDPELVPAWCPTCEAPYCGNHWTTWDEFDGDFHDCIRGRCPAGHERMLED